MFGAGAMGTAVAMHTARRGLDVALWANAYDERALEAIRAEGKHPALPEHVPSTLSVHGPEDLERAADGCEIAVMGASSAGARSLARMVTEAVGNARFVVSLAKGLESETRKRPSIVYEEELPGATVIAAGGPCLASELAQGAPSASVWASRNIEDTRTAGSSFEDRRYQLQYTDDIVGVEYCAVMKNVAAIGLGFLDGLAKLADEHFRNARAALFTRAVHELSMLVTTVGGEPRRRRDWRRS